MSYEINIILQIVRSDGHVSATPTQFRASVSGQYEVEPELFNRTSI